MYSTLTRFKKKQQQKSHMTNFGRILSLSEAETRTPKLTVAENKTESVNGLRHLKHTCASYQLTG